MKKNADYYKKKLELEPVKCNGFLKLAYDHSPNFNFSYYLTTPELVCPWHTMGTLETCHHIDGAPMTVICIEDGKPIYYRLFSEIDPTINQQLHLFIKPQTMCAFFVEEPGEWSLISHFHFPSYDESTCKYFTEEEFNKIYPHYPELGKKYGLKGFYNKKSCIFSTKSR